MHNLRAKISICRDKNGLARAHIALQQEVWVERINRHALAGHGIVRAQSRLAATKAQRADSKGVAKGQQAHAVDEHDDCVATLAAAHDTAHRVKELIRRKALYSPALQLLGKDIEKKLAVAVCVDVAVLLLHRAHHLFRVGEVAIVRNREAKGGVYVERLGLGRAAPTSGRIADMTNANISQ